MRKIGTAPIQKEGSEYELDICGLLDDQNTLMISKSRCPEISSGIYPKPGKQFAQIVQKWMNDTSSPSPVGIVVPTRDLVIPNIAAPVVVHTAQEQPSYAMTAVANDKVAQIASVNGQVAAIASTNGHVVTAIETSSPSPNVQQTNAKPDNPAKAAFKALLAVTNQPISKVIETSIELYGADERGVRPQFTSENMTAVQIKAVCEALMREWLGAKGYPVELAQNLIDISSLRHPSQYADIAKDIDNQIDI